MREVDEVRTAADIVKIVGDYVKLRKAGVHLVGLCPFHQEKTPSFSVHPAKQVFHCFGCKAGGDVFNFVMLIEHLTFPEALRRVAEKAGVTLRERIGDETYDAQSRDRAALYKLHEEATKFFQAQLGATAEGRAARGYLADRGLGDETIARFRLGYAPSHGQGLTRHLLDLGFEVETAEKSGLVLRDQEGKRHFDRFRRRIMFPISNESGKVVAFGGRALGDDQPKYLNSPETPIYTKSRVLYHLDRAGNAIRKADAAVLVEGYMDSIAVASAGIERVVASCGTSLTDSQIRLLARYTRRVVVNYDPDSAGVAATERSLAGLLEEGFEVKVLALPAGLDPDAFIKKQGGATYEKLLSTAPSYIDYLTERAASQHDLGRPEGKAAAVNTLLPYVVKIPNRIVRTGFVSRVAQRLRVDEPLLRAELKRAADQGLGRINSPSDVMRPVASPGEKQLLRAMLENEELPDEFLPQVVEEDLSEGLPTAEIFKALLGLRRQGGDISHVRLQDSLNPEDQKVMHETLFWPEYVSDREHAVRAVLWLKGRKLQAAIEEAKRVQDWRRVDELLQAKAQLAKQLSQFKSG